MRATIAGWTPEGDVRAPTRPAYSARGSGGEVSRGYLRPIIIQISSRAYRLSNIEGHAAFKHQGPHSVDRIRGPGGARRLTDARAPDHRRSGATTKPFSSRAVSARCIYKLGSLQSSSLFIPRSHRRQSSDRPRCGSVCWCRPAAGNSRANPLAEATSSWAHGGGRRRTSP